MYNFCYCYYMLIQKFDFFNNFVLQNATILNLKLDYDLDFGKTSGYTKIQFFIFFYIGPGKRIRKRQHIKMLRDKNSFF